MAKRSRRKKLDRPRGGKQGNKDTKYEERKVAEWTARLEAKQQSRHAASPAPQMAQSARTHAVHADDDESDDDESEHTPSEADMRVLIKVLYQLAGSPPEEDWGERDGTIAHIRHTLESLLSSIPSRQMIRRTLTRLATCDMDVAASKRGGTGRPRILSRVDDMLVGLLAVEGQSQRNATRIINAERKLHGLSPVDRKQIRDAERRVELKRRKRRKTKSGSCDLESAWCKASFAQATEWRDRFDAGAALRGPRPLLMVGDEQVSCAPVDPWRLVGSCSVSPLGSWWQTPMSQKERKRPRRADQPGDGVARNLRARARRRARDEKTPQGAQGQSHIHGLRVIARV